MKFGIIVDNCGPQSCNHKKIENRVYFHLKLVKSGSSNFNFKPIFISGGLVRFSLPESLANIVSPRSYDSYIFSAKIDRYVCQEFSSKEIKNCHEVAWRA